MYELLFTFPSRTRNFGDNPDRDLRLSSRAGLSHFTCGRGRDKSRLFDLAAARRSVDLG
jgi:hypothetical protein